MAIDGGSVVFTFNGDTTPFTQSLTQLQKGLDKSATAAEGAAKTLKDKLAVAQKKLEKETAQAAQALKHQAAQAEASKKKVKDFADMAGDADSTLMGFSGALGLIDEDLEAMSRVAGDAIASVEAMGKAAFFSNPIFLALGAAALALGAAYTFLGEESEEAAEEAYNFIEAQKELDAAIDTVADTQTDLQTRLHLSTGALTEQDVATMKLVDQVTTGMLPALEHLEGKLVAQEKVLADLREETTSGVKAMLENRLAQDEWRKSIAATEKEIRAQEQALQDARDLAQEVAEKEAAAAKAKENATRWAKARADREKELEAALKATADNISKLSDMEEALDKARAGATGKLVLGMDAQIEAVAAIMEAEKGNQQVQKDGLRLVEQIVAFTREQIAANQELEDSKALEKVAADLQKIADLESAVVNARLTGVEAIDQWEQEQLSAIDALQIAYGEESEAFKDAEAVKTAIATEASKRRKDLTAEEIEAQRDLTKETLSALEGLASASGEAISFLMERQLEETGKVSLSLYRLSQVAALAEVAFKTSVGYMEAGVVSVANPVLGAIMYAGVSVAAATSTASILAAPPPTLHSGGMVEGTAPDEVTLVKGEGVVNTLGMEALGQDGLSQLNRGAGANTVIVQQFKHKVLDVVIADSLNRNSPLRRAVRGDRPRGIVPRNGV